jgi:hypothetical protein
MKKLLWLMGILSWNTLAFAQNSPVFKMLRFDENWTSLRKDTSSNWYNRLKYNEVGTSGKSYISVGGEVRYQYFAIKNEDWGDTPADKDGYVLTRYLAHIDYHISPTFRAFFQLQSSLANSRINPSPVEENTLDIHQAFADAFLWQQKDKSVLFRVGRQEMTYGSQRLIAVREAPNNRLAFDGLKFIFQQKNLKSDVFYTHPIANKAGIFDDAFNKNTQLWGFYSVINHASFLNNIDLYYLGIRKKQATYDAGNGEEIRHSVGTRIWKNKGDWQYDFEGVFQFGTFAQQQISAWTLSSNTTYQFSQLALKPKLGLKTEAISGDRNLSDNRLQTFNPLYPKGAYFGLAALIGPSNLFDFHPSLDLEVNERLEFGIDYDIFWRLSRKDGIYAPNMSLIYSGKNTNDQFIGTQLSAEFNYQLNPFLFFRLEGTWFETGPYLKEVSTGKDILFTAVTTQFKF